MLDSFSYLFSHLSLVAFIDLFLVWLIVYQILLLIKRAGATQIIVGLIVFGVLYFISRYFEFLTFNSILEKIFSHTILIIIILFQGEIRRALARLGRNPFTVKKELVKQVDLVEEVIQASIILAQKGYGALIVIEREITLDYFIEKGIEIDSKVSASLLESIFHPKSPLHDGALIIRGTRAFSAGCFLPLSRNTDSLDPHTGTRHRAALGLTEATDAVILVISEEKRSVGLAYSGKIISDLDLISLRREMFSLFSLNFYGLKRAKKRESEQL